MRCPVYPCAVVECNENVLELYAACRAANVGRNVRVLPARLVELALRNRSLSKLDGVACCGDALVPYDVVPAKLRGGGVYVELEGGACARDGRTGVVAAAACAGFAAAR